MLFRIPSAFQFEMYLNFLYEIFKKLILRILLFWPPQGIWSFLARDQIPATAATSSCSNAGSLTHCAGPGIEPAFQQSQNATNPIAPLLIF